MKVIRPQKGFQEKFVKSRVDVVFGGGSASSGKGEPYDADIVTPFGIRKMGDLKVGDTISGTDGGMQRVIDIHELGERDVWELQFVDGAKVECTSDHLWNVRESRKITKKRKLNGGDYSLDWRVMTMEQIMKRIDKELKSNTNLMIPLSEPIQFTRSCTKLHCRIDPYILGLLLGDGCMTTNGTIILSSMDDEIVASVKDAGYDIVKRHSSACDYSFRQADVLKKELAHLGLIGTYSHTKFVPKIYMTRDIEFRRSILQGLMDTDGTVDKGGHISFTSTSEQLAKDVQWLIWSLGGKATITKGESSYNDSNGIKIECKDSYDVYINIKNQKQLFRLKRKQDRCLDSYLGGEHLLNRRITGYKYIGKKQSRCIAVSNPNSLYITNDFIVTHNTYASCLIPAYFYDNPQFRAVYVRRNLGELIAGGGLLDTLLDIYPKHMFSRISETGSPVLQFESGAELTLTHFADESPSKFNERVKGWQYPLVYLDELTAYEWSTFSTIMTRNRGSANTIPMVRATCNPKRNSWVRRWLDWYIGEDGFIMPERDGVVRYFYMMGKEVDDVVWGQSKEEVYEKCKHDIDRKMFRAGKSKYITKESFIKSFVFYRGTISENEEVLKGNPNYMGSLAATGGAQAQQLLEGNWNVDEEDDMAAEISTDDARGIFTNEPNLMGRKAITADIALTGTDNMVVLAWLGFHVIDKLVIQTTDAPKAIMAIKQFAARHDVPDSRIIFDGTAIGAFVGGEAGFIKGAIPFMGGRASAGNPNYSNLKAQCADKLIALVKSGLISCSPQVATSAYYHQKIKTHMTFADRLIAEFRILRFDPRIDSTISNKKRLITKKRMVEILGTSPDIIDNLIMRIALDLDYQGEQYDADKGSEYDDDYFDEDDIFNYI